MIQLKQNVKPIIAVVIPAYKVAKTVDSVIKRIGKDVQLIIVVDDGCPENSGIVAQKNRHRRIILVKHDKNQGVGAAMISGYKMAVSLNADVVVKVDGDGQIDPQLIPNLVAPLLAGQFDYAKGNRFQNPKTIIQMPKIRIFGNLVLSFFAKFSTGYWNIFDPNNGFTAITSKALKELDLSKISSDYFFESDMLFRLYLIGANIYQLPMNSVYEEEKSNLSITKTIPVFTFKHTKNFLKRIIYTYYIKDFNIGSIELPVSIALLSSGSVLAISNLIKSSSTGEFTNPSTLILIAMLTLSGLQIFLNFISIDMNATPTNNSKYRFN